MITKSFFYLGLAAAILTVGCVTTRTRTTVKVDPPLIKVINEYFDTVVMPQCDSNGCDAFTLVITNKTGKNLEVNWNKTLYIMRGQTSGGFMFEGVLYKDRNNQKTPDIVFGNSTFSKKLWPNNLVEYSTGKYGGWRNESMPSGENGIYLTVNIDGKEISQKLITNISISTSSVPSQSATAQGQQYSRKAGESCGNHDDCGFGGLMCIDQICKSPF
jgi:hypothetical protein